MADKDKPAVEEEYEHEKCPKCGHDSVPAEDVPDQTLRGCNHCGEVWPEGAYEPDQDDDADDQD